MNRLHPALRVFGMLLGVYLLAPIVTVVLASLTTTRYVTFPPQGLTLRWYMAILERTDFVESLLLSLLVGVLSATLACALSFLLVWAIERGVQRGRFLLTLLALSPMALPAIVLGVGLLHFYSGIGLGASPLSLILGHTILVFPFTFSLTQVGLAGVDRRLERAAMSLGASPWQVFRHVTLPLMRWAVLAGWAFAFVMSFGDLSVALFLQTPGMMTLPVRIYAALVYSSIDPLLTAVSSGLVLLTLLVVGLVFLIYQNGVQKMYGRAASGGSGRRG